MRKYELSKFKMGWFIGNFKPSLFKTRGFEIAIKQYKKGDKEKVHFHKVANEISVIIKGSCRLNKKIFKEGEIVWVKPNETVEFEALEDCTNAVIKIPSVKNDKYEIT